MYTTSFSSPKVKAAVLIDAHVPITIYSYHFLILFLTTTSDSYSCIKYRVYHKLYPRYTEKMDCFKAIYLILITDITTELLCIYQGNIILTYQHTSFIARNSLCTRNNLVIHFWPVCLKRSTVIVYTCSFSLSLLQS